MLSRRRGSVRQISLLFTLPLLFTALAAALYWGWQMVWQAAPWSPQFSLHPANIEISNASDWVDQDAILQQVVHEASLDDQLSLLDPGLNERLSLAIGDHPWVEKVEKVEKFQPPRVVVTLRYREPVARVENNTMSDSEASSHCIVDRDGVLLPLDALLVTSPALQTLPRIEGVPFRPPRPGEVWQDGRIRGGVTIASELGNDWRRFSLQSILPSRQPIIGSSESYSFQLLTAGGKKIPWGPQYVDTDQNRLGEDEPLAREKADRLREYVRNYGVDLDGNPIQRIDANEAQGGTSP